MSPTLMPHRPLLRLALLLLVAAPAWGQAGSLDTSFGQDGVATLRLGISRYSVGQAAAVQPDGRVVVAGHAGSRSQMAVARFDADGALDVSFGGDGTVDVFVPDASRLVAAQAVVVRPDGRVVVGGWATQPPDRAAWVLAQLQPDGRLDETFGDGGYVVTTFGEVGSRLHGLALQPDGRIVAAGTAQGLFSLVRYLTDGSLDPAFGTDGRAALSSPGEFASAQAVAVQSDGRIVAVGNIFADGEQQIGIVRTLADGTPDASFATEGRQMVGPDLLRGYGVGYGVALVADRIVAVGLSSDGTGTRDVTLVGLQADGALDPAFGGGGVVKTRFLGSSYGYAIATLADGRVVVAGQEIGDGNQAVAARYLRDGTLDPTFGDGGRVRTFGLSEGRAVGLASDGDVFVAGTLGYIGGASDVAVARLDPAGQPDPSWGAGGRAIARGFGLSAAGATHVALQPAGGALVAGTFAGFDGSRGFVARFTEGGALDVSYGEAGVAETSPVRHLAVLPDGGALVTTASGLLRLTPAGRRDDSFGTDGLFPGAYGAFAVRLDGRIFFPQCGTSRAPGALLRLMPDGRLDTESGQSAVGPPIFGGCQTDAEMDADGRFVGVTAYEGSDHGMFETVLVRMLPDGRLDPSFGADGVRDVRIYHGGNDLPSLAVLPDGSPVIVGSADITSYGGQLAVVARFTPGGDLDRTFGTDGVLRVARGSAFSSAVTASPEGGVLFWEEGLGLLRARADGTLDTTFGTDGAAESPAGGIGARALAVRPDGRILVAGYRGGIGGSSEVALAQVLGDNAVPTAPAPDDLDLAVAVRPNPVAGRAAISLTLPAAAHARVEVLDLLGRRVAAVWDGPLVAGTTPLAVDVGALAPGVYVVRAAASGRVASVSVTVVR